MISARCLTLPLFISLSLFLSLSLFPFFSFFGLFCAAEIQRALPISSDSGLDEWWEEGDKIDDKLNVPCGTRTALATEGDESLLFTIDNKDMQKKNILTDLYACEEAEQVYVSHQAFGMCQAGHNSFFCINAPADDTNTDRLVLRFFIIFSLNGSHDSENLITTVILRLWHSKRAPQFPNTQVAAHHWLSWWNWWHSWFGQDLKYNLICNEALERPSN